MEIRTLFGLPAHPLVVHGAVILVPLAALGVMAIALVRRWRQRFGVVVVGLAAAGLVFAFLAVQSGEQLREDVPRSAVVSDHAELGDRGTPVAFGVIGAAVGVYGMDILVRRRAASGAAAPSWERPVGLAIAAGAIVVSLAATAIIVQIGHSGAKATWEKVGATAPAGNQGAPWIDK